MEFQLLCFEDARRVCDFEESVQRHSSTCGEFTIRGFTNGWAVPYFIPAPIRLVSVTRGSFLSPSLPLSVSPSLSLLCNQLCIPLLCPSYLLSSASDFFSVTYQHAHDGFVDPPRQGPVLYLRAQFPAGLAHCPARPVRSEMGLVLGLCHTNQRQVLSHLLSREGDRRDVQPPGPAF